GQKGGAALIEVHRLPAFVILGNGDCQRCRARTGANDEVVDTRTDQFFDSQFAAEMVQVDRFHAFTPTSNSSAACSFCSSSSHSRSGPDPATMPAPAKRITRLSQTRAERRATANTAPSGCSIPTGPA